jgi:hypothetical protein
MAKHGDLAAGAEPPAAQPPPPAARRPPARIGGELNAERGPGGAPTGNWVMDNNSSYSFLREDLVTVGQAQLDAVKKLLQTTGTDTSMIITRAIPGT